MKRSHRSEFSTHGNAGDRFEGEYPVSDWHRGRDAEASKTCYAPSKYPTKQWPTEAQLELWCSLSREAHNCFVLAAETAGSDELFAMNAARAMPRVAGSRSIAALNANQPPGANGNLVRDRVGSALDTAFSGIADRFGCGVPWKDQRVMSQTLQFIERAVARGANISALCRELGISRQTGQSATFTSSMFRSSSRRSSAAEVDLVTPGDLRPELHQGILAEAVRAAC